MSLYFASSQLNNCVSFNHDASVVGVGHNNGFAFYKTSDILDCKKFEYNLDNLSDESAIDYKNCLIVEKLYATGLLVLVAKNDPRTLQVFHMTTRQVILEERFSSKIVAVKLTRMVLIVCLETVIHIFRVRDLKKIYSIIELPPNETGAIDTCIKHTVPLVAYPHRMFCGTVVLFDVTQLKPTVTFAAHENQLACIKFNQDGTKIATASIRGTVIRVFSTHNGSNLHEFRRGTTRWVNIYSMSFSPDSKFLVSSSNTETIHVYKLEEKQSSQSSSGSWYETFSAYVPSQIKAVSDLITVERSHAYCTLPATITGAQAAMIMHKEFYYVLVASLEGYVHAYRLKMRGGEMMLTHRHRIGPSVEKEVQEPPTTSSNAYEQFTVYA